MVSIRPSQNRKEENKGKAEGENSMYLLEDDGLMI